MHNDHPNELKPPQGRDLSVDVIKGLAIVLLVYGHTWPFCCSFIHLFHPSIFLVTSGFCMKSRICTWGDWRRFMAGKVKTLYLPCAICNGIYALLGGLFLLLGLYTDDPAFLTLTAHWPVPQKLYAARNIGDILQKFFRCILLTDTTQLGTATWFLIMLFVIFAFHGAVCCLTAKLDLPKKRIVFAGLFILTEVLAQFADLPFHAWMYPKCFFYCYLAYLAGIGIRDLDLKFLESPLCGGLSFVMLAVLSRFCFNDLANANIVGVLSYLAGVLGGWSMLKALANQITVHKRLTGIFCFFGRHTMPILCLHVLCFKPITWLYLRISELPKIYLAAFHVDFDAKGAWKLLYTVTGLALSLLLEFLWHRLRKTFPGKR